MTDSLLIGSIPLDFDGGPVRHPVIRTGERDPIPLTLRRLVLERDGERCRTCGRTTNLQLDHVMPWSAGGPDTATNLRVLCADCNTTRSNWKMSVTPRLLPVTVCCDECFDDTDRHYRPVHYRYARDCLRCVPYIDARPDLDQASVLAWCGLCEQPAPVTNRLRLL